MPLRAVVISFDHLHAGYLGCYGNEWVETPHLDRFASGSVVFDTHLAENLDLRAQNHAWWTGRYQAVCDLDRQRDEPSLVERLSEAGVGTWLVVESDGREAPQVAPRFENVVTVRGEDGLDVEERRTPFARVVQRLIEQLPEIAADDRPSLLWVKSRGVPDPWLPPQEFADLYLDEFGLSEGGGAVESSDETEGATDEPADPYEEPEEVWSLESGHSVDLKYAKALYAAYVTWLDRWFGQLLHELAKIPGADDLLIIVTGASGQTLGEHGELDVRPDLLRAEVIHTPLIIRLPDRAHDATRRPAITQPVDLLPTLCEWFGVVLPGNDSAAEAGSRIDGRSLLSLIRQETDALRDVALIANADEWGIRTNDFLLIQLQASRDPSEPGPAVLLFEKPHDRWDQSDVSSQYPQVVEELQARLLAERLSLKGQSDA